MTSVANNTAGDSAVSDTRCMDCGAYHGPDHVFCPTCRIHLLDRHIGRRAAAWRRLIATLIDWAVNGSTLLIAAGMAVVTWNAATFILVGAAMVLPGVVATAGFYANGETIGKRLLGLRVITADGQPAGIARMVLRELPGKALSAAVLGLGLLRVTADRNGQGWHDRMLRTYVVRD
jgi:uncharacterized RDD family membrane protein YckC